MRIFYKDLNTDKIMSAFWSSANPIENFLNIVGNVEYVVVNDNTAYNAFYECLKIENGVLSYDLALLKEAVQQVRKVKCQELFKPYDKVFENINALEIPESEFNATHAELKTNAEAQRIIIRNTSETQKTAINNATTAEAVLAIYQEIINTN